MSIAPRAFDGLRLNWAGMTGGWIWVGIGAVVLVLVFVLSRQERRLVSRRMGWGLLILRLGAALALVTVLFEPILQVSRRETLRGRVVLGLDQSASMDTPDSPIGTRREVIRQLLERDWLDRIRRRHEVETFGFAREAFALTTFPLTGSELPAEHVRQTTDWTGVLRQALADHGDRPVAGVVLLTDGRFNGPDAAESDRLVARLKDRGIPVYPVLIGSTTPPRDVAIAAIDAPETVETGQTARISLTIKADGLSAGSPLTVELDRPEAEPLRQTLVVPAGGARPIVTFVVPFVTGGTHELSARVGPVEEDVCIENDRRVIRLNVSDDKARVLLIDREARWEFQYLRNVLQRDPHVSLTAIVLRQPPGPGQSGTTYPTALPTADTTAADPLGSFDLIILGDVIPTDLPPDVFERIERRISERGGTLVIAAGPQGWPALGDQEAVARLLPVRDVRPVPVDAGAVDPLRPVPPAGARFLPLASALAGPWPMLQLSDDPERNQNIWLGLPSLPWVLSGAPKPTATVLATAANDPSPDEASLAAMPYGLGKVLWVGTDGTWRWRYRIGDDYHHRFWGQIVAWASRGKLMAGNRFVQFGAVPPRVVEGTPELIRARLTEAAPEVDRSLLVAARILPADPSGPVAAVVPLRPSGDPTRMFEGTAPALPAGTYRIRLVVPQLADVMTGDQGELEAPLEVAPRATGETIELAAARDPLDRLASATGGRVFTPAEIDALGTVLGDRVLVRTRIVATRLAERPESLGFVFLLLTLEWILRKRAGLA